VVIGAGPAGLGAALGAKSTGAPVVVLEAQTDPGSRRRGETVRYDRRVEALLGSGFFDRHTIHTVSSRRYFSPTGERQVDRRVSNPNRIVAWPDLVDDLTSRARAAGAELRFGCRVDGLQLGEQGVEGVVASDSAGEAEALAAGFVVAADGHAGVVTRCLSHDRRTLDFPVRKLLVAGSSAPQQRLEYHLHVAADGSPCIGCSFPRGGDSVELILLVWPVGKWAELPSHQRAPLLQRLTEPGLWPARLRRYLDGAEVQYSTVTQIAMGGLQTPLVPMDGLVLVGGAAGQVQARGGSGIVSSLLLGHAAGRIAGAAVLGGSGQRGAQARAARERALAQHPVLAELRRMHRVLHRPRQALMAGLRSPRGFDRAWPLLKLLLR